jgi:hypothetical protein
MRLYSVTFQALIIRAALLLSASKLNLHASLENLKQKLKEKCHSFQRIYYRIKYLIGVIRGFLLRCVWLML